MPSRNSAYGWPGVSSSNDVVDALEEVFQRAAHVPEVLGRSEHDGVARAHVVGVGVERALDDHVDTFDVVAGRAPDNGVGQRLGAARTGVVHDEQLRHAARLWRAHVGSPGERPASHADDASVDRAPDAVIPIEQSFVGVLGLEIDPPGEEDGRLRAGCP